MPELYYLVIKIYRTHPNLGTTTLKFSIHGDKAKIAHLYAMMHAVTHDDFNIDDMFELNTLKEDSFRQAVGNNTIAEKPEQRTETVVGDDEIRETRTNARNVSVVGNKLQFVSGQSKYTCEFKDGNNIVVDFKMFGLYVQPAF